MQHSHFIKQHFFRTYNNNNWISMEMTSWFLWMYRVVIISSTTWKCIRKNEHNIMISSDLWHFPTTQNSVVKLNISTGFHKDPDGLWDVFVNNQYSSPELFVILKMQYKTLAMGLIWTNRIGGIIVQWIILSLPPEVCLNFLFH